MTLHELNIPKGTTLTSFFIDGKKFRIGGSNSFLITGTVEDLPNYQVLSPDNNYLGAGTVEKPESLEFGEIIVVKSYENKIAALVSDKTMLIYDVSEKVSI